VGLIVDESGKPANSLHWMIQCLATLNGNLAGAGQKRVLSDIKSRADRILGESGAR